MQKGNGGLRLVDAVEVEGEEEDCQNEKGNANTKHNLREATILMNFLIGKHWEEIFHRLERYTSIEHHSNPYFTTFHHNE